MGGQWSWGFRRDHLPGGRVGGRGGRGGVVKIIYLVVGWGGAVVVGVSWRLCRPLAAAAAAVGELSRLPALVEDWGNSKKGTA